MDKTFLTVYTSRYCIWWAKGKGFSVSILEEDTAFAEQTAFLCRYRSATAACVGEA